MKNWTYREGSTPHFQGLVYCEETGEDIAVTYHDEGGKNARLIAAAPDLLEALRGLLSSYAADFKTITGGDLNDTESVKQAKDAINKATQP